MQKMNYKQWKEEFLQRVREYIRNVPELENRGTVEVQVMSYINGEKREGLAMPDLNPSGVSPVVRLSNLYKGHQEGIPDEELAASVTAVFIAHKDMSFNTKELFDYETMKSHLRIRVSGVESNEEWIKEKICEVEGDFIHSCYLDFPHGEEGHTTINVDKRYAEVWNVSETQVMEDARKGSMIFQVEMTSMYDVLNDMMDRDTEGILRQLELMPGEMEMFILHEKGSPYGASVIARQDILEAVGEVLQDNYYVFPASINEVIILPAKYGDQIKNLGALVREINEKGVPLQDKLSDHVQFYDRSMNLLMNADEYRRKMEREPEPEEAEGKQSPEELEQGLSL